MQAVAVYARVSTQRQAQANTPEQQLERLRTYVQAQGWNLPPEHVFRDDGYSGATLHRPGLDRLRDAATSARFDRILITAPDRLARNYVHQVLLVEELQRHGAEVEFLDRPMSQDPHDQLLLQIRGAVAEYERTLINERMRRGRLRKLRAGTLLPWTQPPYGYRLDPDRPRDPAGVRLDEAEAALLRDLFAWYGDEGATLLGLRKRLLQLGITSPQGRRTWSSAALHGLLTNPTYTGQVFANRVRTVPARMRGSARRVKSASYGPG
jgi:site-specific DNA recombinase